MSAPLSDFFKSFVDPYRGTVLVQGGHKSGKTTLLNALLGYHALPYFATAGGKDDALPIHGMTASRYSAGVGATAVCLLNAATIVSGGGDTAADDEGEKHLLKMTNPESGTIQQLVVANSLKLPANGFPRPGDEPVPPTIRSTTTIQPTSHNNNNDIAAEISGLEEPQDSAAINDPSTVECQDVELIDEGSNTDGSFALADPKENPSAFFFVDKVYNNSEFDEVSSAGTGGFDSCGSSSITAPVADWEKRTQQAFYYDAVASMESNWKEWAVRVQQEALDKKKNGGNSSNAVDLSDEERMLFVVGINSDDQAAAPGENRRAVDFRKMNPEDIVVGAESLPPLHCVESTDLSDRPPMTYVHSNLVVLSDAHDFVGSSDKDGARRMYVQATLFSRANTEPCLVYNLVTTSLKTMPDEEVHVLRAKLSRAWNVRGENIFIFSLRNALADVMLARENLPTMNHGDTAELDRLRRVVVKQHLDAHARFSERVLHAREKQKRALERKEEQNCESQQGSSVVPSANKCATSAQTAYIPKVLRPECKQEAAAVSAVASEAALPTTGHKSVSTGTVVANSTAGTQTVPSSHSNASTSTCSGNPNVVAAVAIQTQHQYTPKFMKQQGVSTIPDNSGYVPKALQQQRNGSATTSPSAEYVPKTLLQQQQQPVATPTVSPASTTCGNNNSSFSSSQQESYLPKCVATTIVPPPASQVDEKQSTVRHRIVVGDSSSSTTNSTTTTNGGPQPDEQPPALTSSIDLVAAEKHDATTATTGATAHSCGQPIPPELHAMFTPDEWMAMTGEEYDRIVGGYIAAHPQQQPVRTTTTPETSETSEAQRQSEKNFSTSPDSSFDYLDDQV